MSNVLTLASSLFAPTLNLAKWYLSTTYASSPHSLTCSYRKLPLCFSQQSAKCWARFLDHLASTINLHNRTRSTLLNSNLIRSTRSEMGELDPAVLVLIIIAAAGAAVFMGYAITHRFYGGQGATVYRNGWSEIEGGSQLGYMQMVRDRARNDLVGVRR
ncbi:hypothetical protein MRB53_041172 [Persea americana]|nr:hypothetical protein MRB53_041172 [Persea americana]